MLRKHQSTISKSQLIFGPQLFLEIIQILYFEALPKLSIDGIILRSDHLIDDVVSRIQYNEYNSTYAFNCRVNYLIWLKN